MYDKIFAQIQLIKKKNTRIKILQQILWPNLFCRNMI